MRLICPNCGAQYEVPTEVIPETGRDVQCSDCGTTWFQHHPDHPPEEIETPAEADVAAPPAPAPAADPDTASDTTWDDDAPEDTYAADYGAEDEEDDDTPELTVAPAAAAAAATTDRKRREIDPSVADVLREEAEREARARETDQRGGVETQQELGLQETANDAQRRSEEARARMARLRGEPEADKTEAELEDIDPASRSNLLPDIDEINSSLDSDRPREEPRAETDASELSAPRGGGGFRSGFRVAILIALLGLLLYIFAPQLADAVPQLAGPLGGYVDMVNSWRMSLNDLMLNMASSLSETDA